MTHHQFELLNAENGVVLDNCLLYYFGFVSRKWLIPLVSVFYPFL